MCIIYSVDILYAYLLVFSLVYILLDTVAINNIPGYDEARIVFLGVSDGEAACYIDKFDIERGPTVTARLLNSKILIKCVNINPMPSNVPICTLSLSDAESATESEYKDELAVSDLVHSVDSSAGSRAKSTRIIPLSQQG